MIFRDIGQVVPGFHVLGTSQMPSYLLDGVRPVLFDSGLAVLGPRYVEHARRVLGDRQPDLLVHTHVHFDHCGATSALKEAFPGLRIGVSPEGAEILRRPRALELIRTLNEEACLAALPEEREPLSSDKCEFRPFGVDLILRDGDRIDVGDGQTLEVLSTPGHTRDFLSFYIPERRILVASEAAGCAHISGAVMAEFVSDYDGYLSSLRRLSALDVDVLCQGHVFVYVGEDARGFLARSLEETERYRIWVERLLAEEHGDIAAVVQRLKVAQWAPLGLPKQPESAYLLNTEARVKHLASRLRA